MLNVRASACCTVTETCALGIRFASRYAALDLRLRAALRSGLRAHLPDQRQADVAAFADADGLDRLHARADQVGDRDGQQVVLADDVVLIRRLRSSVWTSVAWVNWSFGSSMPV